MDGLPDLGTAGRSVEDLGLVHEVDVDPFTGAANVAVALPLTTGRSGLTPGLGLAYSSGGGNSPYGLGWSLTGVPTISVATAPVLPRYDARDRFMADGDELVPELVMTPAGLRPRTATVGDVVMRYHRSRYGRGRTRFEQWLGDDGDVHWRTRDENDVLTVFGADPALRMTDPATGAVYCWLPQLRLDPSGNAIRYDWSAETTAGVDAGDIAEFDRLRAAAGLPMRYLKRVRYGNTRPLTPDDPEPAANRWCFELVLDYGDHAAPGDAPFSATPGTAPDRPWPCRADPFSTYRPGFEVRIYRRCRRFLMFHRFAELGDGATLVWATTLEHQENPAGATLTALRHTGFRREPAGGRPDRRALPPLSFSYSQPQPADAFESAGGTAAPLQNLPGTGHRWSTLHGDGVPGVLSRTASAWYFTPHEGDGRFGTPQVVPLSPTLPAAAVAVTDFDGDGNTEAAVLDGRAAGYYALDRDTGRWDGFRTLAAVPHLEAAGGHAQYLDLDGDGRPDLVVSGRDRLTWYASRGREGFGTAVEIPRPASAAMVQAGTVAEDRDADLLFADMNGDGLSDLVHVRDGRVEYWPQLGHGRFGPGVVMAGAPVFEDGDRYDPARLHLVDLDGSGTADLLYVGRGRVRYWVNAGGNRLLEGPSVPAPYIEDLGSVQVVDLQADGTPWLVWSSPMLGTPLRYLRLTGGVRPRLLLAVADGMGREVRLEYSTSAAHYLRDRRAGRGWRTRIPRHPVVVDRRIVHDKVRAVDHVARFEYHDGVFDGGERVFRGFSLVDRYEEEPDDGPAGDPEGPVSTLRRTWYHPGVPWRGPGGDVWTGDAAQQLVPREEWDPGDLLPDLTSAEHADGLRALVGRQVREELFGVLPGGARAEHPYRVSQETYRVRRRQPATGLDPAGFDVHQRQSVTAVYEQEPDDPRVTQHAVLAVDDAGNATLEAIVGYPRRKPPAAAAQARAVVTAARSRFARADEVGRHLPGLVCERRDFAVSGLAVTAERVWSPDELAATVGLAAATPLPHDAPFTGGVQARTSGWLRTLYWDDTRSGALALESCGTPALVHHQETACFTPAFVTAVYGGRITPQLLRDDGRYVERDGHWWATGPVLHYAGTDGFCLPLRTERSDGAVTTLIYDPYRLVPVSVADDLGHATDAVVDYHQVVPWQVTDTGNGTVSQVAYDPLGVAVVTTSRGSALGPDGLPHPHGHDLLDAYQAQPDEADVEAVLAAPARFGRGAAQFTAYDLGAWSRSGTPSREVVVQREEFAHDGAGGGMAGGPYRISVRYFDGERLPVQVKLRVEPGDAVARDAAGHVVVDMAGLPVLAHADDRWQVSGHIRYDAHRRPVRQYQPFHSGAPDYEGDAELARFGVSSLLRHDAMDRVVAELLPNGTTARTEFAAWLVRRLDPNDTVADSRYRVERDALPATDPENLALRKAMAHAGTPVEAQLDPRGREAAQTHHGATGEAAQTTSVERGDTGEVVAAVDPLGRTALRSWLDLAGRALRSSTPDAGDTWVLPDADDRTVHDWNALGVHRRSSYDHLDRLTRVTTEDAAGAEVTLEELGYGDAAAGAAGRNGAGRLVLRRDATGSVEVRAYDPAGQVLEAARRLATAPAGVADWSDPDAVPLGAPFVTRCRYDALGRLRRQETPDGIVRHLDHLAAGAVARLRVEAADGSMALTTVLDEVTLDARGQRTSALLGNRVRTAHGYDAETFRSRRHTVSRDASPGLAATTLRDARYTYDPAGNLVHAVDEAQQPAAPTRLLTGSTASTHQELTYDAWYRLVTATGRVHQALLGADHRTGGTRHLSLNNGAAVERYTQIYQYDAAGNLTQLRHHGVTQSWTDDYWVSPASNRALPALDANGVPVSTPEDRFDAAGRCRWFPHVARLEWTPDGGIARAVVVDRSADGQPDDDETYVYGSDGLRVRATSRRLVGGVVEERERIWLDGCELVRVRRAGTPLLERATSDLGDGAQRVALLHRWTLDTGGRETADVTAPALRLQVCDRLGSTVLELDPDGAVVGYEEYFPYGGTAFIAGASLRDVSVRDHRFHGAERDRATGLYLMGHRCYAPWLGRFLSPDPAGPQDSLNLYQFVRGNPVNLTDPDGLQATPPAQARVVEVPYKPSEERLRAAWEALPAARRAKLSGVPSLWRVELPSGNISFVTAAEALAIVRQAKGDVGYSPDREAAKPSASMKTKPKPGLKAPPKPAVPRPAPPGRAEQVVEQEAAVAGTVSDAQQNPAGTTGTTTSKDPAATVVNPADGGRQTGSGQATGNVGSGMGAGNQGTGPGGGGQDGEDAGRGDAPTGAQQQTAAADAVETIEEQTGPKPDAGTQPPEEEERRDPPRTTPAATPTTLLGPPTPGARNGGQQGTPYGSGTAPGTGLGTGTGTGTGTSPAPGARRPGATGQGGTGRGRSGSGTGSEPGTLLDRATEVAGWLNFARTSGEGVHDGIPGGLGLFGWRGPALQVAYVIVSVINTILMVQSIVRSVAFAAVRQSFRGLLPALRNPLPLLRGFAGEIGAALRWTANSLAGRTGAVKPWTLLFRLVRDPRTWETVRAWRRSSFWFRLRTSGGNNVFHGSNSLYTAEHIIAQSWPDKFPRLFGWARPYLNSYLNTFWQVPRGLNSAMSNKFLPKLSQYWGSGVALVRSWRAGQYVGEKAAEPIWQAPDDSQP